jgi:phage recombination protein Bet
MNAVVDFKEPTLPSAVVRRNISEPQWRTLMNNLYPGAAGESVLMVWDYCVARKLDPLKKPCHIVPMEVKDAKTGSYIWRDVVMPGIYEYRTTAQRTGEYLGHSEPQYGPVGDYKGVMAPEWCSMTVYRWNPLSKLRAEFPVKVEFKEIVATKRGGDVNARWSKAPKQMLTKCTEAAGLREAFPDELGGTHTVEEMEGQNQTDVLDITPTLKVDPRGDVSNVDWELRDKHVNALADIMNADKDEVEISAFLNEYVNEFLQPFPELYITVSDKLAADGIISKSKFREYLKIAAKARG